MGTGQSPRRSTKSVLLRRATDSNVEPLRPYLWPAPSKPVFALGVRYHLDVRYLGSVQDQFEFLLAIRLARQPPIACRLSVRHGMFSSPRCGDESDRSRPVGDHGKRETHC